MSKVDNLVERYEHVKEEYSKLEEELRQDEALLTVKKDELQKKREELEKEGIKFSSLKELRKLKDDLEQKIEMQLEKMEQVLGVSVDEELEDL